MNQHSGSGVTVSVLCFPYYPSRDTGRGHDRYILELVENLQALGDELRVDVVEQGFSKGVLAAGGKVLRLAAELLSKRSDVYHAISPNGGAVAALLGKRPLVVTIHDLIPFRVSGFDSSWKARFVRFCSRVSIEKSAAIVVPYRVTKDEIVNTLGGSAERIFVVNYGVDHATYYPRPELTRSPNRILYIGEVSRSKGVDVTIRAFAEVKRQVPNAELVIGGKSSKDQAMLEELARSLGVQDLVFKGFIPEEELATYYSTAAVMVFPSRYGFGLSTLEAMACGTPVVAAAALDAQEFAEDIDILVPPDDHDALAARITRILTDTAFREELSSKGIT
ncbi:MAG TPA: glycosyltransferase family 4 protein, partial [Polyangiaceae bacterium]|nr:glycosyltransferase family 4 protein [Polyangiaceae bacterium]